jgi:dTDP-4-amino-4,6-dideoxygalactose transaminase
MINVTQTFLPPLEEYVEYLKRIWESGQVTNNGPLLRELEQKLKDYLQVEHLFLTSNGTVALQIAIRAAGLSKKVITTPFSYVATTGSLLWEYCTPVFVDINPDDYCIDPSRIEEVIDEDTEAILAVHVYGYACDVGVIEDIACRNGLKVIYDAAHAFGSRLNGKALASYGDISTLSFHATKIFHTIEGGAIVTNDDDLASSIRLLRAFGHIGDEHFTLGINGKNSELHAAMGLCLLPRIEEFIELRRRLCIDYDNLLLDLPITRPINSYASLSYNHAYYPVIFDTEATLEACKEALENNNIFPRRYFFPALNRLPYFLGEPCPIAESIASRILCLPLSHKVDYVTQKQIAAIIKESIA